LSFGTWPTWEIGLRLRKNVQTNSLLRCANKTPLPLPEEVFCIIALNF